MLHFLQRLLLVKPSELRQSSSSNHAKCIAKVSCYSMHPSYLSRFYFLPQVSLALNLLLSESTKLGISCAVCMHTAIPLNIKRGTAPRAVVSGDSSKLQLHPMRKKKEARARWTRADEYVQLFSCKLQSALRFIIFFLSPSLCSALWGTVPLNFSKCFRDQLPCSLSLGVVSHLISKGALVRKAERG